MQHIALIVLCIALIFVSYYSPEIGLGLFGALAVVLTALHYLNLGNPKSKKLATPRDSVELGELQTNNSCEDSSDDTGRIPISSSKDVTDINTIEQDFDEWPTDFKSMLEMAPLEGIDFDRPRDSVGRSVDPLIYILDADIRCIWPD